MSQRLKFIKQDLPVVCTLTGAQQAARLDQAGDIFNNCTERIELDGGYGFRFDKVAQWAGPLLEFIRAERECCQFLRFELDFEPQLGPLWLYLRGNDDTKEFIRVNFARL